MHQLLVYSWMRTRRKINKKFNNNNYYYHKYCLYYNNRKLLTNCARSCFVLVYLLYPPHDGHSLIGHVEGGLHIPLKI